ncbi:HlyD family secretion protein [Thaumasiovibrio subtropicus]|uniref:HlyD family secretion protein n=1 Tax=Thaumasiovibrio subtropicus TaxID=1891207 RepID=UPI000B351504|nr:HlyD family secretion protein [Thaumasiovibrio subtropicus]
MKVKFYLDKQQQPTSEQGVKVIYGSAKRSGYQLRWYFLLLLIVSPLLVMLYYIYQEYLTVKAPGIVTVEPIVLTAAGDGVIAEVHYQRGEIVQQGQRLISIKNALIEDDIAFLHLALADIEEREVTELDFARYEDAIKEANRTLRELSNVKSKYDEYLRTRQVSQVDYATVVNLKGAAEQTVSNGYIDLNQAQINHQQTLIAGAIARLRLDLQRALSQNEIRQAQLLVHSPYHGFVVDSQIKVGQRIEKGDELATISSKLSPKIVGYLSPRFIAYASKGSEATVQLPDGTRLRAEVSLPTELASKLPPQLAKPFEGQPALLKVTLAFLEPIDDEKWVEGMPVQIHF